jgi:hypothetical protein
MTAIDSATDSGTNLSMKSVSRLKTALSPKGQHVGLHVDDTMPLVATSNDGWPSRYSAQPTVTRTPTDRGQAA